MTTTASVLFKNVNQVSDGDRPWSDIGNLILSSGSAEIAPFNTGNFSNTVRLWEPDLVLPVGAIINNIKITSADSMLGGIFPSASADVFIVGGITRGWSAGAGTRTHELSGDLAYWGITQQEAIEFLTGSREFRAQYECTASATNLFFSYVQVQVDYTAPQTTVLSPPLVF